MYESNKARIDVKKKNIDKKLDEIERAKQKAIETRVRELEGELRKINSDHTSSAMPSEISEFKTKIKALYTHIFQGTKELSIRKNDLVKQIRGEYGSDF